MSSILYQYFLKKTNLDHVVTVGTPADPYFEEIPPDELHFYQRKGARRKRRLPEFIPAKELKILNSVKRKAYRLDLQLSMCGFRVGWAGIIGLIPWIGDVISLMLALQILHRAQTIEGGLPASVNLRMLSNIMFDFGIGLIPIVGDLINIMYKCNSRNFILLEQFLIKKYLLGETIQDPAQNEVDMKKKGEVDVKKKGVDTKKKGVDTKKKGEVGQASTLPVPLPPR